MAFEFNDFELTKEQLENIKNDLPRKLEDFLLTQALDVIKLTARRTPVDTGTLRRNWSVSNLEKQGDTLKIYITNPTEYASFVEHGYMNGKSRIEGKLMVTLSISDVVSKMDNRLGNYMRKFVKETLK